ncbi:WD repeat-containing protein 63 [Homalodisca vitripennis]|nr:WD repeat-containing protein 63 [Homalodisca vitripennis]
MAPKKDKKKVKKTSKDGEDDKKAVPLEPVGDYGSDQQQHLRVSTSTKKKETLLEANKPSLYDIDTRNVSFKDNLTESPVEQIEVTDGSKKKSIASKSIRSTSKHPSSKSSPRTGSQVSHEKTPLYRSSSALSSSESEMSIDEDIVTLVVPETSQKIVHCLIGKDLFVDKTWCMVKKTDILEDVAIQDANSPFFNLIQKILDYKPVELLIGYEPFSSVPNQFMLCITETGRDDVLNRLENLKSSYIRRIEQSKVVVPKKWESLGSEEFVDHFQIKHTRKPISLEWIGDITKRCFTVPKFEDCDPDSMKNGYTCLVPTDKEKFDLVYKKTQETGVQAVAQKIEASAQTEPEIPTNASTQYAPETEISVPDTDVSQTAIKSQDLNAFFNKYLDYLLECLNYNEVYDLYHDDYPALYVAGEETQVQQLGTYHQYQSFTDVAAIEGKLVVSSSWHPNYTGIVAVAYANEIPCLMKELEFDSDQTDYEEEKTDEEGEGGEEPNLGAGARDWLADERKERDSTGENTELFDRAVKRLRDIENAKFIVCNINRFRTSSLIKPDGALSAVVRSGLLGGQDIGAKQFVDPRPIHRSGIVHSGGGGHSEQRVAEPHLTAK